MRRFRLYLLLALLQLFFLQLPSRISAIRKDIGFQERRRCRTTVQGRYLISDDNGYVCDAMSVDTQTRCCPVKGYKFSCQGCNLLSQCCNSYEYCVSCCLNPARTVQQSAVHLKIGKPATSGTYASVFDFCSGRCRHNSESVVHENAYHSDFHHCFSLKSNSSGANAARVETRLLGINVVVGSQGESCDTACKSHGRSCVSNKLVLLNHCDVMQRYMNCKGTCLASVGADQPAEVADDAPRDLNPGACLYTRTESMLSCDGSHAYTKRLCPCA